MRPPQVQSPIRPRRALALLLLLALAACGPSQRELDARMAAARSVLATVLGARGRPTAVSGDLQQRRAWRAVEAFYAGDEPRLVWVDATGPRPCVDELIASLAHPADDEGDVDASPPEDTSAARRLAELRDRARQAVEARSPDLGRRLADLELAASYAFLARAIHTVDGHVDPAKLKVLWFTEGRKADPLELLARVRDGAGPAAVLSDLEPKYEAYRRLLAARRRYRALVAAGGWPSVPADGGALVEGARGAAVAALRRRLAAAGDLPAADLETRDLAPRAGAGSEAAYDAAVAAAVRRFQERHGLQVDGKVGRATLAALNVSAVQRLTTIEVNLERWRWMPGSLGEHYIEVNIPEFRLRAVRGGRTELEMKVIVGRRYHETPVFSDTMTFLVLNPEWNIPRSIATTEVVPKILADPGYAEREGIEVIDPEGRRLAAAEVLGRRHDADAAGLLANLFGRGEPPGHTAPEPATALPEGYRLRQAPGRDNPLGRVKFMFPNEHNVYLHDTPAGSLFASSGRGFSHGCIRLERPLELADYVLRGSDWTAERIRRVVAGGEQTTAMLPQPIPVHLTYFTAWVDDDGRVEFRDDLYGHDARLAAALAAETPLTLDLDERE